MNIRKYLVVIAFILFAFSCRPKNDAVKQISNPNRAVCEEVNKKNKPDGEDPVITKTCIWGPYKTISVGTPDDAGRYNWEHKLYLKQTNRNYREITTNEMFNENVKSLIEDLNKKIKQQYRETIKDPDSKECFGERDIKKYTIDDFGINFIDNKIQFHSTFGIGGSACSAVDLIILEYPISEINKYVR